MGVFILDDFSRHPNDGVLKNEELLHNNLKWLGDAVVAAPFEAHTKIDFTGPLGSSQNLYYSLSFQLLKWEYLLQKADEWIEVSPVHSQYYQVTQKQKEELETKIKAGLTSAAQAIADLELLKHDERKYKEFLDYYGWTYEKNDFKFDKKKRDEHYLKAVFIDQVDAHTGEGISMRSIVSRWPTLIVDFQKLEDNDTDVKKVKDKLNVSRAEATVLVTKNKLYKEWKRLFEPQLKSRYQRIMELVRSREKSIQEYRDWMKPIIARHKLIEEGLSRSSERKKFRTSFITAAGHATSSSVIELWTWRDFLMPEFYKGGSETLAKKPIDPYDAWTKKNFIFGKKWGLVNKYPWITDKWVKEKKAEMIKDGWIRPKLMYYTFFIISLIRTNTRSPTGQDLENGVFDVNAIFFSMNAAFAKLLDLKAKQEEFDRYVDELIGIAPPQSSEPYKEKRQFLAPVNKAFNFLSGGFQFAKRGPYDRDFEERITKYYLANMSKDRYGPIVGFLKKKVGLGTS